MLKDSDFDQPTYADLRLVLKSSHGISSPSSDLANGSPPSKRRCTALPSSDVCSFYTHKVILASKSPVIHALLLRAKELRDLQAMDAGLSIFLVPMESSDSVRVLVSPPARQLSDLRLEILELPMEQEELLACEVLFRSMYSGDLAEEVRSALSSEQGASVSRVILLVQVYRLADRLEVCTDQCAQAISALSAKDCESEDVEYVISSKKSAPALAEHATIKGLLKTCLAWFLLFCDLAEMFVIPSTFERFRQLDFLTVLHMLDSDDMEASENDILTLMGMWMGDDWTDRVSKEQLGAFWNVLRLGHLSTSFISNLTEVAPWLPVDPVVLRHATAWKIHLTKDPVKATSMQKKLQSAHGSSVAWFRDQRKHSGFTVDFQTPFGFNEENLTMLLAAVQHSGEQESLHTTRSPRDTYNGYDIIPTFSVEIVSDGSKKTYVLSVGFEVISTAYISGGGSQHLVHVKASLYFDRDADPHEWEIDDFVSGSHAWELMRLDTLDDFSCLDHYLDEYGSLHGSLDIDGID